MAQRKYLDLTGLTEFKAKLLDAYSKNDQASFSDFAVAKAGKADILATARTIGLSGDVSGTASFDGSENITIATTIADVVASSSGEGGSHGLMTATQAEKLAGIATGAQVNVIEGVATSNSDNVTVANKIATIDLSAYALKSDIAAALNFKGEATGSALAAKTTSNTSNGDVYTCTEDSGTFHTGYEYAAVVSGDPATLSWVELGKYLDLSGYALKTQKVNNKALSGDITLDGSDIALSSSYAKASSASAVAAGDSIDTAVGKLEKKVDDAVAAATTYAFATGTTNGTISVTPTVGGVQGSASEVAVAGLGSAAYENTSAFVSSTLTPAEAGAQVNDIEIVKFKGKGAESASALTIDSSDKSVTVDVSAYALTSDLANFIALTNLSVDDSATGDYVTGLSYNNANGKFTTAKASKGSVADNNTGLVDGGTVYSYFDSHKADGNVIETVKVNGSALTPDANKAVDVTVPVTDVQIKTTASGSYATAIESNTTIAKIDLSGYAVDSDIISITTGEIDALFPASTPAST